jgi:quercetin dioxygenase-like cupin family protein
MPATEAHTYLRTHKLAGSLLQFDIAREDAELQRKAADAKTGRAAKTLVKEGRIRMTLIALRKGASLGAHQVEGDVSVHVLRGAFELRTESERTRASKGSAVVIQAGVQHDAVATRDTGILLTACMR